MDSIFFNWIRLEIFWKEYIYLSKILGYIYVILNLKI